MRPLTLACLTLVTAGAARTAAAQTTPPPDPPRTVVEARPSERHLTIAGTTLAMRPSPDGFQEATLTANAAKLFEVLPLAYADLGLQPKELNQNVQQVGTGPMRAQYRLAKQRMSSLVDCGLDGMGLKQADSFAMTMRITTQIVPDGADRATVRTLLQASGRPQSNSGNELHCLSTGALEQKIAEMVAARANK